ncbi:MAG: hypothetical protein AAFX50_08725, partial [Acidobacteriota bacterium]
MMAAGYRPWVWLGLAAACAGIAAAPQPPATAEEVPPRPAEEVPPGPAAEVPPKAAEPSAVDGRDDGRWFEDVTARSGNFV